MNPMNRCYRFNCLVLLAAFSFAVIAMAFSGCEDKGATTDDGATAVKTTATPQRKLAPRVDKGQPPQSGRPVQTEPTPSVQAIIDNDLDRLVALLDAGADVNEQDANWYSLLHHAASGGQLETIKVLIERGADPNIRGRLNVTPLLWAARFNHLESVQYLVEAGAEVNARGGNNNEHTPLSLAVSLNYVDIVDYLASVGGEM